MGSRSLSPMSCLPRRRTPATFEVHSLPGLCIHLPLPSCFGKTAALSAPSTASPSSSPWSTTSFSVGRRRTWTMRHPLTLVWTWLTDPWPTYVALCSEYRCNYHGTQEFGLYVALNIVVDEAFCCACPVCVRQEWNPLICKYCSWTLGTGSSPRDWLAALGSSNLAPLASLIGCSASLSLCLRYKRRHLFGDLWSLWPSRRASCQEGAQSVRPLHSSTC